MKPVSRLSIVSIAVGLVITACTGGGSSQSAATASSGASGSTAVADICTNPPRADGKTITFAASGGSYQAAEDKAWLQPYAKLTGIQFQESEVNAYPQIKAQVDAGQVNWDVVDVGNDFGTDIDAKYLEPIDYTKVHKDELLAGFANTYRVAAITYGTVLAYNTTKTNGQVPQSWADFFDTTKFPGKRGVWDYSTGGLFEIALMADGVAPKNLYPLDLARATKKLDTIKKDLVFWQSGAQSVDLLESGEVTMSMMWNNRAYAAKNADHKPVEIQWNGQILTSDYMVVPKGSPNKDLAMNFIAWLTCKENNGNLSNIIPNGPVNKFAKPDASRIPDLPTSHVDASTAYFDDVWLGQNAKLLDDTYAAWKTK